MERDRQRKEMERLTEEEEGRRRAQEEQELAAQAETENELQEEESKEDFCNGSNSSSEGGPSRYLHLIDDRLLKTRFTEK